MSCFHQALKNVSTEANSVWLGVDVTYNDQLLLINSQPIFIIMENLFCTYFFLEVWPVSHVELWAAHAYMRS